MKPTKEPIPERRWGIFVEAARAMKVGGDGIACDTRNESIALLGAMRRYGMKGISKKDKKTGCINVWRKQ